MAEARAFFSWTPREISLLLSACRARAERREQEAWLAGRYTALAVHDPQRLPARPAPRPRDREMTADEMKRRLSAWRGKDEKP